MQSNNSVGALLALLVPTAIGCSGSNNQEVATLRAELEVANIKINESTAEINRNSNGTKSKDAHNLPPKVKTRLVVIRGLRPNWEYPVYEGNNILGRADQQPVDIDLQPQEPEERIWASRQHAVIICKAGAMAIEDLNSSNGTFVNRKRILPGEKSPLGKDDIIQIGEVQIKVLE